MLFKDQRADRSKESVESPTLSPAAFMQLKAMPCAASGRPEEGVVCTVARKRFLEP